MFDQMPTRPGGEAMNTSLEALLTSYRACHNALVRHRTETYPVGTDVLVNAPGRYVGPGVVVYDGCPADQLAVRLPNGNTWWYPLDCVEKSRDTASTCVDCGRPIRHDGQHWVHADSSPRHPARPQKQQEVKP